MPADQPAISARSTRDICLNCGEPVERTDNGTWWHIDGYAGYRQCRLFADRVRELA